MGSETNSIPAGQTEVGVCLGPDISEPAECSVSDPAPAESGNPPDPSASLYCGPATTPLYTPYLAETSTLRLSLFSSPDVTQREVLEDVVSTRLQQARALIDAGDLQGAKRVLAEARTDFRTYTRAHPDAEVTPRLARLFATIQLYHGEVWDRRNVGEGTHERAVELYQAALRTADTAVALDPMDPESLLIRSEIRHLLSDYGPAMADVQAAARLDSAHVAAVDRYRCRLEELGQRFSTQRREAQEAGDTPRIMLFLTEEIKIAEALRDSEQVMSPAPFNPDLGADRAATNQRWQGHQRHVEELSALLAQYTSAQALANILAPIQDLAGQGHLTQENLRDYVDRGWITFACGPDGRTQIHLTSAFDALGGPEKGRTLQEIQQIGVRAQLQSSLASETDANRRLYYQAKLHLLDGNLPAARIAMMDFKAATEGSQDPDVLMMREEVRGILRHFSLAAIERFLEATGSLSAQRANSWLPLERDISERTGPITVRMLQAMRTFIQEGRADTLDEAIVVLRSEQQRLWADFYRNGGVVKDDWVVTLPSERFSYGSPERETMHRAATEFLGAFQRDPNATHPEVPSVRLEGGALVVPGQGTYNNREVIRVVVGREGGTIRIQDASSRIWVFPPADHDRVVVINHNDVWSPHFRGRSEFYQSVHGGMAGTEDAGRIAGDYRGGHPNTLDELASRLGELGTDRNTVLFDRDFERLVESEMRVGLERMQTTESRQRELLSLAESLRHRSGSYVLTGEILEGLFAPEMERAMGEIPEADVERIRRDVEADRDTVVREVQERLDQLSTSDPAAFRQRFPSGAPSHGEFERMVGDAMNLKATIQMRKLAMHRIDARYDSGELDNDSIAGRAWHIYDDMRDPLDKTWNWADETWDTVTGVVVSAAVMVVATAPAMAVGVAVRVGLSGTSLALRMAAQGGWRYLAARGIIFSAGSITTGTALWATNGLVFGSPMDAKSLGWNILMAFAFDGGGRLWGPAAQRLGIGERAIEQTALRGASVRTLAMKAGNFSGMMATQTSIAATMGELELLAAGHESPQTFWQRLGTHALNMLVFHFGNKAINVATGNLAMRAEQRSQLRMQVAHEAGAGGMAPEQAVGFARDLVRPVTSERPGEARFVPINEIQDRANARAGHDPDTATFRALDERTRGAVVSDTPAPASEGLRVVDHHGPYATADGKNSTMKLLDMMEGALTQSRGNVDRAIERLNIREVTTDNLADGGWSVWIARNQHRVLSDPNLRALIRRATHFEDFTAFGSNYDRADPAVELQAALFARYGEILRANGIQGSDRFSPAQAERVMTEALTAIDAMVGNPSARREAAESFWRDVDAATAAAREAVIPGATQDGQVNFYDMSRLGQFPVFAQWLGIPQAHDLSLQVTVQPMPPAQANGTSVPRSLAFVAIPNGRELPSGRGLLSVIEAMNAAEAARARELGLEPNTWFGKDNVILPNPAKGGTVLTPEEISAVLRNPRNGLFPPRPPSGPTRPAPWMRDVLQVGLSIRVGERNGTITGMSAGSVAYEYVTTNAQGRRVRTTATTPITDSLLTDNFAEIPLSEIRPTENALSRYRLESAANHLDEPIDVAAFYDPATGRTEYFAMNGHHRLRAASDAGRETTRVLFIGYDRESVDGRFQRASEKGLPIPERVADLTVDPTRFDDYRGNGIEAEGHRRSLHGAGLGVSGLSDQRLQEAADWVRSEGLEGRPVSEADTVRMANDLRAQGWNPEELASLRGTRSVPEPAPHVILLAENGTAQRIENVEFQVAEGELWVRAAEGSDGVSVSGRRHPTDQWVSVDEGDTVLVAGRHFARIRGELRAVTLATDDAPVFARSDSGGVILDNGNGQLTKIATSDFHRFQLDNEQAALALLQYHGLDIGPRLIGRPAPGELVISRIDGRSLSEMSIAERQAIPAEAWGRLEGDLGRLRDLGIAHRDIQAGNLLWDGQRLHLIDFGISKRGVRSDGDILQLRALRGAIGRGRDLSNFFTAITAPEQRVSVPEIPYLAPRDQPIERRPLVQEAVARAETAASWIEEFLTQNITTRHNDYFESLNIRERAELKSFLRTELNSRLRSFLGESNSPSFEELPAPFRQEFLLQSGDFVRQSVAARQDAAAGRTGTR